MSRGEIGLGPGHIVLDGDPSPHPKWGLIPQFLAHICCGQMAGWIMMPLGREVGLSPSDIVLDGHPAPLPQTPFLQIDIIWSNGLFIYSNGDWRVRGKIIRSVLCNILCNNCALVHSAMHTHEQTEQFSGLGFVLSHWVHFTVLRCTFLYVLCVSLYIARMMVRWTWWD